MSQPLVSILINNHNYGSYVGAAIVSGLEQTYSRCEVVVVDDGSTDDSWEVISRYADRIIACRVENGGQAAAIGKAFELSSGEIICLLDSDDLFLPDKVARVVEALQAEAGGSQPEWVFHHIQWTDGALKPLPMPPNPYRTGARDFRPEARRGKLRFSAPATSGLSFSRKLFQQMLPIPRGGSDNYLKLFSTSTTPGYYLEDQLAVQRVHQGNWYTNKADPRAKADLQIITCSGLYTSLPAMRHIWRRMYADALATKLRYGTGLAEVRSDSRAFLQMLPLSERAWLALRVAVKAAKMRHLPSGVSKA